MPRRRLSERQKARIRTIQERRRQHLSQRVPVALEEADDDRPRAGRVMVRHGATLAVNDADGRLYHCLIRQHIGDPVCGDRVVWHPTGDTRGVATALLERENLLSRPDYGGRPKPLAANVSQVLVVLAPEPEPNEYLIDQYLVAAESICARAILALNKVDLLPPERLQACDRRFRVYQDIGYPFLHISTRETASMGSLLERLSDGTSILVGQSGVGKSSLIKALLPDQAIQIGRLSHATGLGRHTTSATTCYRLPTGGALIDSPGVRSFRLGGIGIGELERGFREFRPHLGRCRFSDCAHEHEPGCALKEAVNTGSIAPSRLESFRHLATRLGEQE